MTDLKLYLESLHNISLDSWLKFSQLFKEIELKKGDYFIKDGQYASQIGFLSTGLLRAYYKSKEGIEYNKHFFISPCFIGGYSSLISNTPNQINQQALTDCKIYIANYKELTALYPTYPDIETIARKLAEMFFVDKEQREIQLVLLDADKRYEIFQNHYPQLEQLIPQYHIASYLGITPTQLSRIRKKNSQK